MRVDPKMLRQVQQRQEQMLRDLSEKTVEGSAGGGAVKIVMNGQQEIQSITIAPEVVDPQDIEMLQDLIIAAMNEALSRSRDLAEESMKSLFGGMGLPGGLF